VGQSKFRCRGSHGQKCGAILGRVDRFTKEFTPRADAVSIGHGVSVTVICPVCGKPRVFAGWTMRVVQIN
jgi:hypothetical protein